ncbi:MAG: hypothetical protein KDA78_19405 [Planctomycetaceae bacterium]|nr:hypothetical protein [Planctomycetaceae bacterium]
MIQAIEPHEVEGFRPLLPVGYDAGVSAYRGAVDTLSARQLTTHYTTGLEFFHGEFVPYLKQRLHQLSGGVWSFDDHIAVAAGSDVDFMTHLVEAVAASTPVALYPGDWYGFQVGCTQTAGIQWNKMGEAGLACLCVPSVRNGHVTEEMIQYLSAADTCLLNLNLYPTLSAEDRQFTANALAPLLPKSVLSISFSRGFGLTASQLGVALIPKSHPFVQRYRQQWDWLTYFYNAIAARAFMLFDLDAAQHVDQLRKTWVQAWLKERGLPVTDSGSYYVKSFQVEGTLPDYFDPLRRDDIVRLCFKPPQT